MASSASLTTTHLPSLRLQLREWQQKEQNLVQGFSELDLDSPSGVGKDVVVVFRTRPPLENEAQEKFKSTEAYSAFRKDEEGHTNQAEADEGKEEKVEFLAGISVLSAEPGVFVAHVPGYKWSGPTLSHKTFDADLAFGPMVQNDEVYRRAVVNNDLLSLVISGGVGCILAYGQTGSGKTYTMESLEDRIASDIFKVATVEGRKFLAAERGYEVSDAEGTDVFELRVTLLELLGKRAVDLVEAANEIDEDGNPVRVEVPIREDKIGDVRPGLISTVVRSSEELRKLIATALSHRRTSETLRNKTSSRSHALMTIWIKNKSLPYTQEGQLILVDLAGSERYEDSKAHSKKLMDESRENNKSLMNLKECVRAKAKMSSEDGFVHIPWRTNKLTMLLKPIFDVESRQKSKTIIIAHVSPHIQDSVHSVNTLGYAAPFKTSLPKPRGPSPYDATDPRTWNHSQTVKWLQEDFTERVKELRMTEHVGEELFDIPVDLDKLCPSGMTANNIAQMYTTEFVQACLRASVKQQLTDSEKEVLKSMYADVAGRIYYLVITAKTRTRNEIMNSRKKLLDEVYGEAPTTAPVKRLHVPVIALDYTAEELDKTAKYFGKNWQPAIDEAIRLADGDTEEAKRNAIGGMVGYWRTSRGAERV